MAIPEPGGSSWASHGCLGATGKQEGQASGFLSFQEQIHAKFSHCRVAICFILSRVSESAQHCNKWQLLAHGFCFVCFLVNSLQCLTLEQIQHPNSNPVVIQSYCWICLPKWNMNSPKSLPHLKHWSMRKAQATLVCFGAVIYESCSGQRAPFHHWLLHLPDQDQGWNSKALSVWASSQSPLHPPGCLWQKKPLCLKCHMFSSKSEEVFGKFEVHMGMTRSKYKLHLCIILPSQSYV